MFDKFAAAHPDLWEFIKFAALGIIASLTEVGSFALLNYVLLVPYKTIPFSWWLFDYGAAKGGLGTFLSLTISYALAQLVNFFVQRNLTFKATNGRLASFVMYAISVVGMYLFITWLPTVFIEPLYAAVGAGPGAILTKMICMTTGFLIQFPLNKFVIMRKK